jgi:hypothetical protein
MLRLTRGLLALIVAVMLFIGAPAASAARVLRGDTSDPRLAASAAGRTLLRDEKAEADSWSGRDWPAPRTVAATSGRFAGPVAAASTRYGYASNAAPLMMSGAAMNQPIYDNWNYRG